VCLLLASTAAADVAVYASESVGNGLNPKLSGKQQSGKQQFEELEQRGQQSSCWANVLAQLPSGCSKLGESSRARMAVRLANCQFEQSGLPTYLCRDDMTAKACTEPMHATHYAYISYTNYFLHVDNICFYLQAEAFQRRMDGTVARLASVSAEAADRIAGLEGKTVTLSDTVRKTTAHLGDSMQALHETSERQHNATQRSMILLEAQSSTINKRVKTTLERQTELLASQDEMLKSSSVLRDSLGDLRLQQNESFAAARYAHFLPSFLPSVPFVFIKEGREH
jgi:hypothetical protein